MKIAIPQHALVITLGAAASGKSTFLAANFPAASIISSDQCRLMVADDMESQKHNKQAFDLFHTWIEGRLASGKLAIADATNLKASSRQKLREIAAKHKAPVIVLAFPVAVEELLRRNGARSRVVPPDVVKRHASEMVVAEGVASGEQYHSYYRLLEGAPTPTVNILSGMRLIEAPGFDIIGDVHGCAYELVALILKLGYNMEALERDADFSVTVARWSHPEGRKLVFVGDITDRGPRSRNALLIVKGLLEDGHHAVLGNHCWKLYRALKGNKVKVGHGLAATMQELDEKSTPEERQAIFEMLGSLPHQLVLQVPDVLEQVVVTHAGIPREMIGRDDSAARAHALYGEVTGAKTEDGYPERGTTYQETWPAMAGYPVLVHGHTVTHEPFAPNCNVVNVDQGAVFGFKLTAYRYPERELVQVQARESYSEKKA